MSARVPTAVMRLMWRGFLKVIGVCAPITNYLRFRRAGPAGKAIAVRVFVAARELCSEHERIDRRSVTQLMEHGRTSLADVCERNFCARNLAQLKKSEDAMSLGSQRRPSQLSAGSSQRRTRKRSTSKRYRRLTTCWDVVDMLAYIPTHPVSIVDKAKVSSE